MRLTPFLPGRHLAMIFEASSTRTRVSFENGFAELGGNALYLRPGEIHLPGRETVADTAAVLSRFNDAIQIRSKKNETIEELASHATVPVINGMDSDRHPAQSMSDALTIFENAGTLEGVTFAYLGDAAHPCNSLSTTLTKLGLNVRIGNAEGYEMSPELQAKAKQLADESGGSFLLTYDPMEAIEGADFIYTDCWWWTGQEAENEDASQGVHSVPGQRGVHGRRPSRARSSCTACPPCAAKRSPTRSPTRMPRSSSRKPRTACTSRRRSCSPSSASTRCPRTRVCSPSAKRCCPSRRVSSGRKTTWQLIQHR